MIIVFIPGVWDLLHIGHIKALTRAKKFGDILIVGVETDEAVKKGKNSYPVIPLKDRIAALEALEVVDLAVPYEYRDYFSVVENFSIDVICLCEDYKNEPRFYKSINFIKKRNGRIIYLPYYDNISSSRIKEKIKNE